MPRLGLTCFVLAVTLAPSAQAFSVELSDPDPADGHLQPNGRYGLPITVQTGPLDACRPPVEVRLALRVPEKAAAQLEPDAGTADPFVTAPGVYRFESRLNLTIGDAVPALEPFYYGVNATVSNCGAAGSLAGEDGWTYPAAYQVQTQVHFEPPTLRLDDADEGTVVGRVRNFANAPTRMSIEAVKLPPTDWLEVEFPSDLELPGGGESETRFDVAVRMLQAGDFQLEFRFVSRAVDGNGTAANFTTSAYLRVDSGVDSPGPYAAGALVSIAVASWSAHRRRAARR